MNDEPDFEKLLALLVRHEVRFIVCGGVAVALNGFIRTTEDLDILVSATDENIRRLITALGQFGEGHGGLLAPGDFALEPGCLRVAEHDCPIDIFTLMGDMTYDQLLPESIQASTGRSGVPLRHLNRRQLWLLKKDSFRDKDRIDAAEMKRLDEAQGH
jgi:hypothetical protein